YVPHRHVYGEQWIKFMKDGVNATPLPTVNTTGYIDHAAFLGTINPDTNKIPKHLFQGYLNIYNNYFKAPWMPDRTEANPDRKSGSAGMPRPISYAVFCLKKKKETKTTTTSETVSTDAERVDRNPLMTSTAIE